MIFRLSLVLVCALACTRPPPKVSIDGPAEVRAGEAAALSARVSPVRDKATYAWSVSGPCAAVLSDPAAARTSVTPAKDCTGDGLTVSLKVKDGSVEVPASTPIRVTPVPKAEPVWPSPVPESWKILDDYEIAGTPRKNLWGGFFGPWGFKAGQCALSCGAEAGGALRITYSFPMGDSQCGTFEYLSGPEGKPKPTDITPFGKVVFLVKSGDARAHKVRLEIIEYDPYAPPSFQGLESEGPLVTAGPEWQRVEVDLDKVLHPRSDRTKTKSVGLRIERKDQDQASGIVLVDNLAFVRK
jgi:hypothetical protein